MLHNFNVYDCVSGRNSVKYVPLKRESNGFLSGFNAIVQIFIFCLAVSRFHLTHYNKLYTVMPVNKLFFILRILRGQHILWGKFRNFKCHSV